MQVFKSYFKILNKYKWQMIMYIGIFIGIMSILFNVNTSNDEGYESAKIEFAVFDYDDSELSRSLVEALEEGNTLKEISADDKETIQDELYARNISCVLRINEGFADELEKGSSNLEEYLEVLTIPGTSPASVFKSEISAYIDSLRMYLAAGYGSDEASAATIKVLGEDISVKLSDGKDVSTHSSNYWFYNYLAWIIISMCIMGICPTLLVFGKKEIKNRIECSSYHFSNYNRELLMGVAVTGVGIMLVLNIFALVLLRKDIMCKSAFLYILNLVFYMVVALAITFLVSKIVSKVEMLSMAANIIGLGMSFLCGIFVPAEFLGEGVLRIAHFLPAYWYSSSVAAIDAEGVEAFGKVLVNGGIQMLFAIVITVVTLVGIRLGHGGRHAAANDKRD